MVIALLIAKNCILLLPKTLDKVWINDADFVDKNALSLIIKRLRNRLNHVTILLFEV